MTEVLKTLLLLNLQGSVLVILLLLLKSVIRKSFSGLWQRNLWVIAAVFMLLPVWKLVPAQTVEPIIIPLDDVLEVEYENLFETPLTYQAEFETPNEKAISQNLSLSQILFFMWIGGVIVYLVLSFCSYFTYLVKMKKNSSELLENEVFSSVKEKLKIKAKIRIRKVDISEPPLLTGCFFPVVYVPRVVLSEEEEQMIYLHELTHFKHMDLPIKWFVCIVNAINWFNPFLYLIVKNLNEACEIYCDESVTKNMDDDDKKIYMNTILNLVTRK